ncbi:uncharacterized protein BDW43DRAFT_308696 [Aspergillus alliaceus]|uniref:uncharacterized protein n=1 Tax=Petromyces alliaceus TaxID=209559 RepID=UPI0012A6AE0C|nr:uncharacterized protein BDW43DRAFT_308696 [Aspergillus alliaceus]KAB8235884.1 hypothetical protein BDW43DRAFT_308696 [Aspergillus alliaceus]
MRRPLRGAHVYAHPGGDGCDDAWQHAKQYKHAIRKFVSDGGRFMRSCVGAHLAGPWTGLFGTGSPTGRLDKGQWVYFQDGAVIHLPVTYQGVVMGRCSTNQEVAVSVTPFGKGWVGLVGPHPEADESWYEDADITNPEGVRFDIGHDFVETIMAQDKGKLQSYGYGAPECVPGSYSILVAFFHHTEALPCTLHTTIFFAGALRSFVKDAPVLDPKDLGFSTQGRTSRGITPPAVAIMVDAVRSWEVLMGQGEQHAQGAGWEHAMRSFSHAPRSLCPQSLWTG